MPNFYNNWLHYWEDEQEERAKARKYINEEDLEWVRTQQDYRAALLCARENGFCTTGTATLAEIPRGWNTGKHSHGEEAMFIIEGQGFSTIDDKRYYWETGSCLFVPFGAMHQHFNLGDGTVRYLSAMALPLERFTGLAKVMQYEEAGETPMGKIEEIEKVKFAIHPDYGRIMLGIKDAPVTYSKDLATHLAQRQDEFSLTKAKEQKKPGTPGNHGRVISFMGMEENNFKAREVEITSILCDDPGMNSGRHSHMEAVLYVLNGEGYSLIDGERIDWRKGTCFQVQGPQTVHQHYNTGQVESQLLRIHYGIRSHFYQAIAKRVFPYQYYEYSSYTT